MGLLGVYNLCFSGSFVFFHVFCEERSRFSLLHTHFDVCHYLMILCHFDQMNDKIMFYFSIESILLLLKGFYISSI